MPRARKPRRHRGGPTAIQKTDKRIAREAKAAKRRQRCRTTGKGCVCNCQAYHYPHRRGSEPGGRPWTQIDVARRVYGQEHSRKLAAREAATPAWRKAAAARRRRPGRRAARGVGAAFLRAWNGASVVPF